MGSRSKARKRAVDLLYEADQRKMDPVTLLADRVGATEVAPVNEYTERLIEGISEHRQRIDELLAQHAEGWTLERMPPVDRSVLRLGLYELLYGDDIPAPVVIDEAVELVKALSTDDSPRFVNGVLGRLGGVARRLREQAAATSQAVPDAASGSVDESAAGQDPSATESNAERASGSAEAGSAEPGPADTRVE